MKVWRERSIKVFFIHWLLKVELGNFSFLHFLCLPAFWLSSILLNEVQNYGKVLENQLWKGCQNKDNC